MRLSPLLLCASLVTGCPTDEPADPTPAGVDPPVDDGYDACPQETRVGGFQIQPAATYTTVVGAVTDGVAPAAILDVVSVDGDCELRHPRELFCDPQCDPGFTCDVGNVCVAAPRNVDIGPVTVEGLSAPVVMEAISPVELYNFTGDLPHPAFSPGDRIELYTGEDRRGPSMVAYGVEDLVVDGDTAPLDADTPTSLRWTPPTADVDARVHISVDIANHGGVPGKIVCETDDDGALDIGAELVTGLLDLGWSGFPTIALTRRSSDVADDDAGCFDFSVQSVVVLSADIAGLISCSGPEDCPPELTCLADLTCG